MKKAIDIMELDNQLIDHVLATTLAEHNDVNIVKSSGSSNYIKKVQNFVYNYRQKGFVNAEEDLFNLNEAIIPFYIGGNNHVRLLFVSQNKSGKKEFNLYDSLFCSKMSWENSDMLQYLAKNFPNTTINYNIEENSPQPHGTNICGYFVLAYVMKFLVVKDHSKTKEGLTYDFIMDNIIPLFNQHCFKRDEQGVINNPPSKEDTISLINGIKAIFQKSQESLQSQAFLQTQESTNKPDNELALTYKKNSYKNLEIALRVIIGILTLGISEICYGIYCAINNLTYITPSNIERNTPDSLDIYRTNHKIKSKKLESEITF